MTDVHHRTLRLACLVPALCGLLTACHDEPAPAADYSGPVSDWSAYGAATGGGHYARATQITPENVRFLRQAWLYHSGDKREKGAAMLEVIPGNPQPLPNSSWQMTPLMVDGTVYGCSVFNRVFALDAVSGQQKWSFDPGIDPDKEVLLNCRGVSYWQEATLSGAHCERRIISGTLDGRLLALDANDGKPCTQFGTDGQVNLREGLGEFAEAEYSVTSPPAIVNDRIITGAMVLDRTHNHMPGGVVRAYDARTGALLWYWDPVPPGQQTAVDADGKPQFMRGTTNVWSIISADPERDLVFLPTGNTSTDFFGGLRNNLDYWSSSTVALRASTGEVVWHRQWVHHDIWDYDTPAQPTLFDMQRDGRTIPALAQPTKMGHLFIVNRETGESLFPVEERPVSQRWEVSDEYLSPTQPFPVIPAPLHPGGLTADDAWGFTFWDRGECRKLIESLNNDGIFTPPSLQGSVAFPSDFGGNNWGTPAIDPVRGLIILNTMFMPSSTTLIPRDKCEIGADLFTSPQLETPYCVRTRPLLSPLGTPCIAPPWGTLVAVDMNTGDKRWEVPLGNLEKMAPWPISRLKGSPNIGGPSVTAGGLTFIAATPDHYLRAFDSETGEELWKAELPSGGHATPAIYRSAVDQKQYVIIAVGGHFGFPTEPVEDSLIAFALPD